MNCGLNARGILEKMEKWPMGNGHPAENNIISHGDCGKHRRVIVGRVVVWMCTLFSFRMGERNYQRTALSGRNVAGAVKALRDEIREKHQRFNRSSPHRPSSHVTE